MPVHMRPCAFRPGVVALRGAGRPGGYLGGLTSHAPMLHLPSRYALLALTVERIMQRPERWVGGWPSQPFWTDRGDALYVAWNPGGRFEADSLFRLDPRGGANLQVAPAERRTMAPAFQSWHADRAAYSRDFRQHVFARGGDLFLYDLGAGTTTRLTETREAEGAPRFSPDGTRVVYGVEGSPATAYSLDLSTGARRQLTDLRSGTKPAETAPGAQAAYLRRQQQRLLGTVRDRARRDSLARLEREREDAARGYPPTFYTGTREASGLQVDPTERWATFTLADPDADTPTRLTRYVTASGYAEEFSARPKVGAAGQRPVLWVQDLERDTAYAVVLTTLPGAYDAPDYAREAGATADSNRALLPFGPFWSPDGRWAVLDVRTRDNKDRWIARLDPATGTVTSLDHQHDDAWIGGPGISWWVDQSAGGWMPDGQHYWVQSERTGWSHLYTVDVETGTVTALTSGPFEVSDPVLTRDGRAWYFQSSEGDLGQRHVYRMSARGGVRTPVTTLVGRNDFALSPDERQLALLHSESNRPPEVYVLPLGRDGLPEGGPRRLTESPTAEWMAYPWRAAELVEIPASDGARVPARIYRPRTPNGAAVLFVHGAGYLQNAHRWWSDYYREYMFHNLLADRGYVVLDLDYRASEGYGRDWRTAVYRHMGGRDLQDYVDASAWVGEQFHIPGDRVAIYGGSYGGFITLMALFTEGEHFGGGAALRAVTDWAHYNDAYTRNILNAPADDSLAYARSSPIEFAAGLNDPLLMAHGLVDDNVQPQDIFRLSQRLIELGKTDWELALYPVEPHGFVEPASWTDEYRRILELIERSVGPHRGADRSEG